MSDEAPDFTPFCAELQIVVYVLGRLADRLDRAPTKIIIGKGTGRMTEKDPTLKFLYEELQAAIDGLERIADKLEGIKRSFRRTQGTHESKQPYGITQSSD